MKTFRELFTENKDAITEATAALKGLGIDNADAINDAVQGLKTAGVSSFAVREALKRNGLIEEEQ